MTLPELTFCLWDGDPDEHFRWIDMNRLTYNADIIAREAGVTRVQFVPADRAQQFRYDEVQKLEDLIAAIALHIGVPIEQIRSWSAGIRVDYRDFERIESNLYACYLALGGVGERIPAGKFKRIVNATLFPDRWASTPPSIDLDVPMAGTSSELVVFVPHTASMEQRLAEMEARMVGSLVSDKVMRITATGVTPRIQIPIRIALGGLTMIENKTLASTDWAGDGPWTQTVTLSESPDNVMVGMAEGMTSEQTKAFAEAGLHASAIDGTSVTIRAIFKQPTVNIPIGIYYSTASVV